MKERIIANALLGALTVVGAKKLLDFNTTRRRRRELRMIFEGFTRADIEALANSDTPSRYAAAAMLRLLDEEAQQKWRARK